MADTAKMAKEKKLNRMAAVLTKRPSRYNNQFDESIDEGLQDEEASNTHQKKIQDLRKKRDWPGVKKASEEWKAIQGYRGK